MHLFSIVYTIREKKSCARSTERSTGPVIGIEPGILDNEWPVTIIECLLHPLSSELNLDLPLPLEHVGGDGDSFKLSLLKDGTFRFISLR